MAQSYITKTITAVASGAQAETITLSDMYQRYIVTSGTISYTSADSLTITLSGTPYYGMVVEVQFNCNITLANHVDAKIVLTDGVGSYTIIGDGTGSLPAIFSKKKFIVKATYNGTTWIYVTLGSIDNTISITAASLAADAVTTEKILDEAVTLAKEADLATGSLVVGGASNRPTAVDFKTSGYIGVGDGTTFNSVQQTGDVIFSTAGVAAIQAGVIVNADVNASAAIAFSKLASLTSAQILVGSAGNVATAVAVSGDITLSNAGVVAIAAGVIEEADLTANLTYEVIPLLVSFEAAGGVFASVGDFKLKMPYPGTVTEIYAYAVDAIAGTDNGTITAKNNAGTNMTNGVVTFTASDVRGTAYTVSPSADNTFVAGDILTFTTAKTTAGGVVQLSIKVTRT